MTQVMAGVRVLEVAQFWFVPSAGAVLADWGADVIKVEDPVRGDGQRGLAAIGLSTVGGVDFMVQQPNRGKRSVGIDIATPDGREILYRLARESDVFLTNFLPDARERLAIDVEQIRKINPQIVYVRGHGYGVRGPEATIGGYDLSAFWTRAAVAEALQRTPDEEPIYQRAAFGDGIGGMTIAGGVAAALFHRERTGQGSVVDVSLLSTGVWVMSPDILAGVLGPEGVERLPSQTREERMNPVINFFRTRDGRWLVLVHLQPDRYWADLCRRIGRPELAADPRFADARARAEHRVACLAQLDAAFAVRTLEEWRKALDDMEGPWAVVQTPRELAGDRQVIANAYLREVEGPNGKFPLVANPVQFDEQPPDLVRAPSMGEHTDEVLLELGITMEELLDYKVKGAVL